MKKILMGAARIAMAAAVFFGVALMPAQAAFADENKPQTTILTQCANADEGAGNEGGGIFCILNVVLDILSYGVGIAGTLGIVISGVQYLTARDNEQQLVKAKSRIFNIVIGLILYATMAALLKFLLPGGVFGR